MSPSGKIRVSNLLGRWLTFVWTVALGLALGACNDPAGTDPGGNPGGGDPGGGDPGGGNPGGDGDPDDDYDPWATEGLWDETTVPIPCTGGELCYDPDAEEVVARLPAYREFLLMVQDYESDEWTADERVRIERYVDAQIEATHRMLGSCNYWRDEADDLRVECPPIFEGLVACPHMWFLPEMLMVGSIPQRGDIPAICLEDVTIRPGRICAPGGCDEGFLCSGELTAPAPDGIGEWITPIPVCIERARCLELRDQYGLDPATSCIQSNLTAATSPTLPTVDCDSLGEGMCASNCPCANEAEQCQLLTETQSIGLCSPSYCERTSDCGEGYSCVWNWSGNFNTLWTDYLSSDFRDLYADYVLRPAICAKESACTGAVSLSPSGADFKDHNFLCNH